LHKNLENEAMQSKIAKENATQQKMKLDKVNKQAD
jgi:hypothetical protein